MEMFLRTSRYLTGDHNTLFGKTKEAISRHVDVPCAAFNGVSTCPSTRFPAKLALAARRALSYRYVTHWVLCFSKLFVFFGGWRVIGEWSGSAALYKGHHLLVDNLTSGFDLYAFPHSSTSQTFPVPMTRERSIIKDAVFAEDGQVVVCGSDHGAAYVFSCLNGGKKPLQIMYHGKDRDYLQVLDAATVSDRHMVATGSSGRNGSVVLWEKPVKQLSKTERDLADAKDKIQFLIFAFIIWASWSHLPALYDIGVGLGAELGAVRDGLLLG
ncbi:uncharacterized protein EV420DRAFT_1640963 [Desarmillaria tabescens]|uniref:WD40 repeat-like protein n=1 Tax=Armillaria tabescens TaxID=1929756 RepID=A0AA39KGK4_ARMTA|nr:uncharacterized protein EV420DRAFT_1640963 [Desarmillaria tabescens]KAK0460418.1 hypothetical protein EV420DRAFT_1640963 [Desarmillaria tabescens]